MQKTIPTLEEQRAQFLEWWTKSGRHYAAAVIENGNKPWTDDLEQRFQLYARRWNRGQSNAEAWAERQRLTEPRKTLPHLVTHDSDSVRSPSEW